MKRFYTKKNKKNSIIVIWLICIIIYEIVFYYLFFIRLGKNVTYITKLKLDELTTYYLNDKIKKYTNVDANDYIKVNKVNNKIVSIDIDNYNANIILNNILNDLENNVKKIKNGHINNYHNLEMIKGNNGIVLLIPSGMFFNNLLLSNIGPKIPIKINFIENINVYIDVDVNNYGINNSLIKLYVVINIDEVLEIPTKNRKKEYKYLISSKIVNGEVPNFLGGNLSKSSKIVKQDVK